MAVMTAIFAALLIVTAAVGPEKKGISLQAGLVQDVDEEVRGTSVKADTKPFPRSETAEDSKSVELRRDDIGETQLSTKAV